MSELNQWELSIVDRLRYGLQHNQSVTLGADEVHIPMNAIIERGNRRAQPSEKPLTLDELRGMDGEPVWVTCKDGSGARWGIVKNTEFGLCAVVDDDTAYWFTPECGTIAYRRKPKEWADNPFLDPDEIKKMSETLSPESLESRR